MLGHKIFFGFLIAMFLVAFSAASYIEKNKIARMRFLPTGIFAAFWLVEVAFDLSGDPFSERLFGAGAFVLMFMVINIGVILEAKGI